MQSLRTYSTLLLLATCLVIGQARAAVWIAISDEGADYKTVAEDIRGELLRAELTNEVQVRPWSELTQGVPAQVKLLISVGTPAFSGLTEAVVAGRIGRVPLLATLLPRTAYETQRRRLGAAQVSGVVLDQPPTRQMALLRYAFPHLRRVGVLLGPDSRQSQVALEKAAQELGLQLNTYKVDGEVNLYPALQRALEENDVLLAIPDAAVYNGGSIQNVLLASYRHKVPLMGFSPAYVRAGALLALYSTPTQIGSQTVRVARSVLSGAPVPALQNPSDFVVGVNANVARSLGFRLSEDALRIQLLSREGM